MSKFVQIIDSEFDLGAISFDKENTSEPVQLQKYDSEPGQKWKLTETMDLIKFQNVENGECLIRANNTAQSELILAEDDDQKASGKKLWCFDEGFIYTSDMNYGIKVGKRSGGLSLSRTPTKFKMQRVFLLRVNNVTV